LDEVRCDWLGYDLIKPQKLYTKKPISILSITTNKSIPISELEKKLLQTTKQDGKVNTVIEGWVKWRDNKKL